MNKLKKGRKFSRKSGRRKAFIKSLLRALVVQEKIETTQARAKEIKPFIEKLVTRSRMDDINSIRYLARYFDTQTSWKLIKDIAPRYQERKGGYTRIIKLPARRGDGAQMAIIEFV